jgi:hypothetical protein
MRSARTVTVWSLSLLACSGAIPSVFATNDGGTDSGDDGGGSSGAAESGTSGTCNGLTCALGCCQGSTCITPGTDMACGVFGASCQDCTGSGRTCQLGACGGRRRLDAGPG